ncbi:Opi1-domain-containing protein [Parathielavia appendiculata]|uniref:Opi1-domain-containing protein n=1 Tax=Parathielavia appendiculata TaxID=2587402 RepID=A0AAN6TUF0_9PEZI|nr:Opi1-domain-containing protein [Parathielavia appendiculata]
MQTSPNHGGHEQESSDHCSAPLDTLSSLQLPPLALSFPDEPTTTELAPIKLHHERPAEPSAQTLPPLSSVTGTSAHASLPKPPDPSHPRAYAKPANHWPSLNPFTTYYTPSYLDPVESSPSIGSETSVGQRGSSVSLDDPDVRIAAEALGQMKTDCGSSPRNNSVSSNHGKPLRDYKTTSPSGHNNRYEPEPLLSLITTSHTLLATTIEGAASAYNSSKNYSPHLKTGAEYVESYLKPVGKAVGTVGRKTGVEGGVRWIFGMRSRKQHSSTDIETGERGNSKRRKSDRNDKRQDGSGASQRAPSADGDDRRMSISTVDTLPAYDDQRSPAYTETADDAAQPTSGPDASGQQWGQRFVVTTSGLGVAMKQESLKSLKYCLKVVRDTNTYLGDVLVKLKSAIDAYDRASQGRRDEDHSMADANHGTPHAPEDRSRLLSRMTELRDDLFRVIHRTVQTVSKYAGSALPENARNLVHGQLMSLPGLYHFHYVRQSEGRPSNASPDAGPRDSAHLALLFAREALQMMTQVGDVLNRTLVSAEEWCETLYKNKHDNSRSPLGAVESSPAAPVGAVDQDTPMFG